MEAPERKALGILLGVVVIVLTAHLILDSTGKAAFAGPYTQQAAEGDLVMLEGAVDDRIFTKTGGHVILSIRGIPVFVPASAIPPAIPEVGDCIRVIGVVQQYQGTREIVLQDPRDVTAGSC
jgi:hypothetical protein